MPQVKSAETGKFVSKTKAKSETTFQQTQYGYAIRRGDDYYLVNFASSYGWTNDKKEATLFARKKDAAWAKDVWSTSVSIVKVRY